MFYYKAPAFLGLLVVFSTLFSSSAQAVVSQNKKENHLVEGKKKNRNGHVGQIFNQDGSRGTCFRLSPRILVTNRHMLVNTLTQQLKPKEDIDTLWFEGSHLKENAIAHFVISSAWDLGLIILKNSSSEKIKTCVDTGIYNPSDHGPIIPGLTPVYGCGFGRVVEFNALGNKTHESSDSYVRSSYISYLERDMTLNPFFTLETNELVGSSKHSLSGGASPGDSGGSWGVFLDEEGRVIHDAEKITEKSRLVPMGVNAGGTGGSTTPQSLGQFSSRSQGFPLNQGSLSEMLEKAKNCLSEDKEFQEEIKSLSQALPSGPSSHQTASLDHLLNLGAAERKDLSLYQRLLAHGNFELLFSQQIGVKAPSARAYLWQTILYKLFNSADETIKGSVRQIGGYYLAYWKAYQNHCFLATHRDVSAEEKKQSRQNVLTLEDWSDDQKGFEILCPFTDQKIHIEGIDHKFTLASYIKTLDRWVEKATYAPVRRLYAPTLLPPETTAKGKTLEEYEQEAWKEMGY